MNVTDQMGTSVTVPAKPQRIVSLVPSQTELLFDLGLREQVVGVTRFCIHPREQVKNVTRIGGTKGFKFDTIEQLKPDLIIGNKEENYPEGIDRLKQQYPVWMSDIENLPQALTMIRNIGVITGRGAQAQQLANTVEQRWQRLRGVDGLRCAYLIWCKPYMTVGQDTFIHDVLQRAGYENVYASAARYPEIEVEDLRQKAPDVVFLSSEPYPFKDDDVQRLRQQLPDTQVLLVDGEPFSWYGSRLLKTAGYLNDLAARVTTFDGKQQEAACNSV